MGDLAAEAEHAGDVDRLVTVILGIMGVERQADMSTCGTRQVTGNFRERACTSPLWLRQ